MNSDFPRILTLLRKEKGISQKSAAAELGISQALLSHYEKGIRECGLDFLVRCASFYDVSCDYMLGRSPDRQGATLTVEEIPDPEAQGKENRGIGAVYTLLNKKLIANSLNILFDLLAKVGNKSLTSEVSSYLMLAVYRMFRLVYSTNSKNQQAMFNVPVHASGPYTDAAMQVSLGNASSIAAGHPVPGMESIKSPEKLKVSTDSLAEEYPLFYSSLLNLIQHSENRIGFKEKVKDKESGKK